MLKSGLCISLLLLIALAVAAQKVDSLRHIASTTSSEAVRQKAMVDLAWELRDADPDAAMACADTASWLARQLGDTSAMASALLRKAIVLRKLGDTREAQELVEQAIVWKAAARDSLGLALAHANLSQINKLRGDYDVAISNNLAAVRLLEALHQTHYLVSTYNNLAGIHANLGQHDKAVNYYRESLMLAQQLNDSFAISRAWFNLGVASFDQGNLTEANTYYDLALNFALQHKDILSLARLYNGIGSMRHAEGNDDEALKQFEAAESLFQELGFGPEMVMVYNNMAAVFEQQRSWSDAIHYYTMAEQLADSLGQPNDLIKVYGNLSRMHSTMGEHERALEFYTLSTTLKDSLFSEEKNRQIVEMQEKYESAKKDRSIAELNQIQARQEADIDLRNLWLSIIGLLLLVVALVGLNYYQKLRSQRSLAAKELELNRKRMIELVRNHELKTVNAYLDGETAERERLSGALHDRLGSQLATVKLHYDHLATLQLAPNQQQQLEKANALLGKACADVRQVAHNLASGVLHTFGLVHALEDLAAAISTSGQLSVKLDAFKPEHRPSPAMEMALFRSVQELISNTIKHAQATQVVVQLVEHEEYVTVMVSDNGSGFDPDQKQGLGLRSITNRVEELNGSLTIDSQSGHGSTIVIELPLNTLSSQVNKEET